LANRHKFPGKSSFSAVVQEEFLLKKKAELDAQKEEERKVRLM
jgi:hypothetical protein